MLEGKCGDRNGSVLGHEISILDSFGHKENPLQLSVHLIFTSRLYQGNINLLLTI